MKWPGFTFGGSYVSHSPIAANDELVMWYLERMETPTATVPYALYPVPGVQAFTTAGDSPGRGGFAEDGHVWAVIGGGFYEIKETGTNTLIHAVANDGGRATLASNGNHEIAICVSDHLYIYNRQTGAWNEVLTHGATQVGELGGYFVLFDKPGQQLRVSGINNGLTWDPLQASGRSLAADPLVGMIINNSYVYLMGQKTMELWKNKGGASFPLAPLMTVALPYGLAATHAITKVGSSVQWVSHNDAGTGNVLQTEGVSPREIHTHPVNRAVGSYTKIDDAVAWGYQQGGHHFTNFDFPSAKRTWTFDDTTSFWHRRGTWDVAAADYGAWRPCAQMHEWGLNLVLDRNSGTVYRLDPSFGYDVDNLPIRRLRRTPALYDDNKRIFLGPIEVVPEVGKGAVAGQGVDPQMLLRLSYNGGKTWGSWRARSAGKLGQYNRRVRWERNGSGRIIQAELVVTDPIFWPIADGLVETEREAA